MRRQDYKFAEWKQQPHKLDEFTLSYLGTALWAMPAQSDENGHITNETPGDGIAIIDLPDETIAVAVAECQAFQSKYAALLEQSYSEGNTVSEAGHNFLLNRNGHGAGFWDGDYSKDLGNALSDACKTFGENDLYIGDDGKAYWERPAVKTV